MHFDSRHRSVALPPDHRFGYFFTLVFALVGLYFWYVGYGSVAVVFAGLGSVMLLMSRLVPARLAPLNRAWMKLGLILGRVVSPIVLGLLFFGLITPIALILRLTGRDELHLKLQAGQSHWVQRDPPGPPTDGLKNQF